MLPSRPFHCLAAAVLVAPYAVGAEADPGQQVTDALAAMNAGKWEEALGLLARVTDQGDAEAPRTYGPQFGVIWYRRGVCELQLRKWQDAVRSFQRCYQRYPNTMEAGGNVMHKKALLRWGEAAMGAEDWETAIRSFRKFLDERDRDADTFPQGMFHVNLAICHYKLGQLPEGNECLETAVRNRTVFPTPDSAVATGLQELVAAAIRGKAEQALLDFLGKNRADLILPPGDAAAFAGVHLKLAADLTTAGMSRAAFLLYQLVPDTHEAIDDLRAGLAALSSRPALADAGRLKDRAGMQGELERLEKERREGRSTDAVKLNGIAVLHENAGNVRGAAAAYEQLERYHGRAPARESNLFHLVRTTAMIGEGAKAETYGRKFLAAFPASNHAAEVRRLLLTTLFYEGHHERAADLAGSLIAGMTPGGKEHDLCLHVLGGALYYLGQKEKARPLLDEHVSRYPGSPFALEAAFFQASNAARMEDWARAAGLLDSFLARHPDGKGNPFHAYALYDRACCHAATGHPDEALAMVERLSSGFPAAEVLDMAMNLKGSLLQAAGDFKGAEVAFKRALEAARKTDHRKIAEEATANLEALAKLKKEHAKTGDPEDKKR